LISLFLGGEIGGVGNPQADALVVALLGADNTSAEMISGGSSHLQIREAMIRP
jgi:hypothetical protein